MSVLFAGGASVSAAEPVVVDSIVPTSAYVTGGDVVTFVGSGLDGVTSVKFGADEATITSQSETVLSVTAPAHIAGAVTVMLFTEDGEAATLPSGFTYLELPPQLTSISPAKGPVAGGQTVTITGQDFLYGETQFVKVDTLDSHTCGVSVDQKLFCWGINSSRQLGDGTTTARYTPTHINGGALIGKKVVDVAVGQSHTLAVDSDGYVYAWGYNGNGQLGGGTITTTGEPLLVQPEAFGGKKVVKVDANASGSFALTEDGWIYSWGYSSAALGISGTTGNVLTPTTISDTGVLAGKKIVDFSVGSGHVLAVDDEGQVYAWGGNAGGTLGNNSITDSVTPIAISSYGEIRNKKIVGVAAGSDHSMAVDENGTVYTWGQNGSGQLGRGNTTVSRTAITLLNQGVLAGKKIIEVAAMGQSSIALDEGGVVYTWGKNNYGQLGNGLTSNSTVPVSLAQAGVLADKKIVAIAGAGLGTAALGVDENGRVYGWGNNTYGQLGTGSTATTVSSPVASSVVHLASPKVTIGEVAQDVELISGTELRVTTLPRTAEVYDVTVTNYDNQSSTLEDAYEYIVGPSAAGVAPSSGYVSGGDTVAITGSDFSEDMTVKIDGVPVDVTYINSNLVTVVTPPRLKGKSVDVVVTDAYDQNSTLKKAFTYVEFPPTLSSLSPSKGPSAGGQTVTLSGENFKYLGAEFKKVAAMGGHTCGISTKDVLYCWGSNTYGQLGDGTTTTSRNYPAPVDMTGVMAGKTIVDIAIGTTHTLALDSDGRVYAWGANSNGQLGDGSTTHRVRPVILNASAFGNKKVAKIAAGLGTTISYAITEDGLLYGWGYNSNSLIPTSGSTNVTTPTQVSTISALSGKKIVDISIGSAHVLLLDSAGQVYAWGSGTDGKLGNNSTLSSSAPVNISGYGAIVGKKIVDVAAGQSHSLALDANGTVYAWGANSSGQLGDGTTTGRTTPQNISTNGAIAGRRIVAIDSRTLGSVALDEEGIVYTWGSGSGGQLGNGATSDSPVPVSLAQAGIMSNQAISAIAGGGNRTFALDANNQLYGWGTNNVGQLGDGSTTNATTPVMPIAPVDVPLLVTIGAETHEAEFISSSELRVTTLPQQAGVYDVTVTNYDGQASTLSGAYEYVGAPLLTSISPSTGHVAGGDTITLTGANFSEDMTVTMGGEVTEMTYVNSSTLLVVTPPQDHGKTVDVTVTDILGQSDTLTGAFTYTETPPTLESISPTSGPIAGGQTVTLTGRDFVFGETKYQKVSAHGDHTCAISLESIAYCWGSGANGRIGNGQTAHYYSPEAVDTSGVLAGKKIVDISAGLSHTLALDSEGRVYAWGYNNSRQLGDNTTTNRTSPIAINPSAFGGQRVVKVEASSVTSFALTEEGRVYAWGGNTYGQLGNGSSGGTAAAPTLVTSTGALSGKTVVDISSKNDHVLALDSEGRVYAWGNNTNGALGNNSTTTVYSPINISSSGALAGKKIVDIATGVNFSMALDEDGHVYTWGLNGNGQLGRGNTTESRLPVDISGSGALAGKKIVAIAAQSQSGMALDEDGVVYTWGRNGNSQLGDGKSSDSTVPLSLAEGGLIQGKTIVEIVGGQYYAVVKDADGHLYGWGANNYGQLGNGASAATSYEQVATKAIYDATPKVAIGGVLHDTTLLSSAQLRITTLPHEAGVYDVTVTNYDGQSSTLSNAYKYVGAATVDSITPNVGSVSGGDAAYIIGENFTSDTSVTIGGVSVTTTYINDTTLLVVIPARANPGTVDVVVTDGFGQSTTLSDAYTYRVPSPTITSVSPDYIMMTGGTTVTLTGSGFVGQPGQPTWYDVMVDDVPAEGVTFVNSTTLRFTAPAHAPGAVSVTVGGEYSDDALLEDALVYLPTGYEFVNEPRTIMATEPGEFTVRMIDTDGNPITSTSDVTLSLSSTSMTGFFAQALSGEGAGWDYDTVVIPAGESSVSFYYRDTASGTPTLTISDALATEASQQVTVSSRYKILVTGISDPIQAGVPSSVTVQAVDYTGAPQADYRGTIHFTSADGAATLPADYTFTAADRGRKTFINGVTMGTIGVWSVIATDIDDETISGAQDGIVVEAPASGTISKLQFITPEQSFPLDETSSVITVQTQDVAGLAIPVAQDTTIYLRSSSTTGQFSLDNGVTWTSAPVSTVIPAGSSFRNALYRDTSAGTYQIKASQQVNNDFGWQVATQSITIGVGAPAKLGIDYANGGSIGQWMPLDITLTDVSDNKVTAPSDVEVSVDLDGNGQLSLRVDGSGATQSVSTTIPTGSQKTTIWVRTLGDPELTVTAVDVRGLDESYEAATRTLLFGDSEPFGLVFSVVPDSVTVRSPASVQVSIRDQFGNIVPATENTSITISSESSDATFAATTGGPWVSERSVEILAGATTAPTFFKHQSVNSAVPVHAETEKLESADSVINVVAGAYAGKVRFSSSTPEAIVAGQEADITVELLDAYGNPTIASETVEVGFGVSTVSVATWNGQSAIVPNEPGAGETVIISAGEGTATAAFRSTLSGPITLQVYDQARWARSCLQYLYTNGPCAQWAPWNNTSLASQTIAIIADVPTSYAFASDTQVISRDTISAPFVVELRDQYGNAAHFDEAISATLSLTGEGSFALDVDGPFDAEVLTFAAGQASATFYYRSETVSSQQGNQIVVSGVDGVGNTLAEASQYVRVVEGFAAKTVLDTDGRSTVVAGDIIPVTVKAQTEDDTEVIVLEDTSLTLTSDEGEFSLTETPFIPVSKITLSAETSRQQLFFRSTVAGITQLAAHNESYESIDTEVSVLSNVFYKLDYTQLPDDNLVEATKASGSMVVTAYDEYGNVATPSDTDTTLVALSSNKPSGRFALELDNWSATNTEIIAGTSSSQPFYYQIGELNESAGALVDSSVLGLQTLRAIAPGALAAEAEVRVVGSLATRLVILSNPQSVKAGHASELVTVQLQNTDGTPAIASVDQTISLTSLNLNDDGTFHGAYGSDVFSLTPGGDPSTSVTVPAGQSKAEFYVMAQTAETHRIRASSGIYSHLGGYLRTVSATQQLSVVAGDASKLSFTTIEQTVHPNKTSDAIKIALTDEFGNVAVNTETRTIALVSTCETGQFFAIPSGAAENTFTMTSGENEIVVYYRDATASASPCEISAHANGLDDATQNLVVREPVYALAITSDPQTVQAGQTSLPIVVETRDRFGNTVTAEDPISLLFAASGGDHTITPGGVTIPSGSSSQQFTFRHDVGLDAATTFTVTARDSANELIAAQQQITVVPGAVAGMSFNTLSYRTVVGDYQPMTIQMVNRYGKRTPTTSALSLTLIKSAATGAFYKKNGDSYEQVSSITVANGASQSDTLYYRQTTSTRPMNGYDTPTLLRAQHAGMADATANVLVNAKQLGFSTGSFSAQASSYMPLRITISSPLTEDLEVTLSTTATSGVFSREENETTTVTSTVIPAGETQGEQLYYRQTDPTTNRYPETLTATPGQASVSVWQSQVRASFFVNQFSQLVFIAAPSSLEQNQTGVFTVEARDNLGNVVPFTSTSNGYCLYISSSSATATIGSNNNTDYGCVDTGTKKAFYVTRNQTRMSFAHKDVTIGESTITVASNSGTGGIRASTDVEITGAKTTQVAFDRSLYGLVRGDETTLSVRLTNLYDYAVNDRGNTVITLTSDSPEGRFYNEYNGLWVSTLAVTFGAGETERTGIRYSDTTPAASTTIRATAEDLEPAQAAVNLGVGAVSGLVFKSPATVLERGEAGTFRVGFVDAFNNESPATTDFCLYIQSSGSSGVVSNAAISADCQDVTLPDGQVAKAIHIAAGQTEATFDFQSYLLGDAFLTASTLPTGAGIATNHTISIVDGAPVRIGIEPVDTSLERGGILTGRAVLYNAYGAEVPALDNVSVRLSSDFVDGEFAIAGDGPWSGSLDITIPLSTSSVPFLYRAGSEYLGDITLSSEAINNVTIEESTAHVSVVMGEVAQLVFITPEPTTTATHPSDEIIVEARNRYGAETVVESDLLLYPRSTSSTGVFAMSPTGPWGIGTAKILAGQSQLTLYYRDETVGTHILTVRDKLSPQEGEPHLTASQQHHIIEQVFSHFIVTNISSPTRTGIPSSVVVFAVDSENYVVAGYDGTITFVSDDPTAFVPTDSYTFVPEVDRGIHTFTNSVAFKEPGIKSVTAIDKNGHQGTQYDIEVLAGNSAPVRAVTFGGESDTIAGAKGGAVQLPVVQLRDGDGALTNAPAGGMPLHLISDSQTGEFSTDQNSWSRELDIIVEEGLSFSTTPIYFHDSQGGTRTITVSDWIAGVDSPLIANDTLTVTINDIALEVEQQVYSYDFDGVPVENPYLFAHNKQGEVSGYVTIAGATRDLASGVDQLSDWMIAVGQYSHALSGNARLSYQSPLLTTTAGGVGYPVSISAISGSYVSSWHGTIPVSPWRAQLDEVEIDDTVLRGHLATWYEDSQEDSAHATIELVGGVNEVIRTWSINQLLQNGLAQQVDRGEITFRVPLRLFAGGDYRVTVQLSDGYGITAEDGISFSVAVPDESVAPLPTVPGMGGVEGGNSGTISPETPGDTSSRPEIIKPAPPREGAYEQEQKGLVARILESPETPIRVAQSMLGVIVTIAIVLLYQMYREWKHARLLMAIIRRDNETLANKDAFLQLASHHLRTPLTLLSSGNELIRQNASATVAQIGQQLSATVAQLKGKAEDILQRTSTSETIAVVSSTTDVKTAQRTIYSSPIFWLPLGLSVVMTVGINIAVQLYGKQSLSMGTIFGQLGLLLLGAIVLYTAIRLLVQRREQSKALEQSHAKVRALNETKIAFAREVGRELADDILHLSAYTQQLASSVDAPIHTILKEGTERLERLVSRFNVLDGIYTAQVDHDVVNVEQVVDSALQSVHRQNPAVGISLDHEIGVIPTRRSRQLVARLLQDIFTSMTPLAGAGTIKIDAKKTQEVTKLTITGPAGHDRPAEDLFSVYSRSQDEQAGTYSVEDEDNRMHRLDLYLDRIIADELNADLEVSRLGNEMRVTVALPTE